MTSKDTAIVHKLILQRTTPMSILGRFITYQIPGYTINAVLIIIAVSFLIQTGFAPIALISMVLIVPTILIIHLRFVTRGTRLLGKTSLLEIQPDAKKVKVVNKYPHTFSLFPEEFKFDDITSLIVRGSPLFGYFIEIKRKSIEKKQSESKKRILPTQVGLWYAVEDAQEFVKVLQKHFKVDISEDFTLPEESE